MPPATPRPAHKGRLQVWRGARLFDGTALHRDMAVIARDGVIETVLPGPQAPPATETTPPGILCPGFVDLQVNGGGGHLLGQGDAEAEIAAICATHARLGATAVLPTLITASPQTTTAVIAAARRAAAQRLPGLAGLHLEGPFLDPRRKGAHDAAMIRPMEPADLAQLIAAARDLPALMVTLAPASATPEQIAALAAAGIIVSLGHADCTEAEARAAFAAGARCVTHLYNAMSPLAHRAPGLVGAALDSDAVAGIIADGQHVAPTALRIAARAKPGQLFAVTDAMAVAGTELQSFALNGRTIRREQGRLTLADGTLAGADVTLAQSLRWLTGAAGLPLAQALAMVTAIPARLIGADDRGHLGPGARADLVLLSEGLDLLATWQGGQRLA